MTYEYINLDCVEIKRLNRGNHDGASEWYYWEHVCKTKARQKIGGVKIGGVPEFLSFETVFCRLS